MLGGREGWDGSRTTVGHFPISYLSSVWPTCVFKFSGDDDIVADMEIQFPNSHLHVTEAELVVVVAEREGECICRCVVFGCGTMEQQQPAELLISASDFIE